MHYPIPGNHLQLAVNYLDAEPHETGWTYVDGAAGFAVTTADLRDLGRRLASDEPDAFAEWLAAVKPERL